MFYQSIISSLLDVSKEDKGLAFPGVSHVAEENAWQFCISYSAVEAVIMSWLHLVSITHFSLTLSAECSYVHGIFFQLCSFGITFTACSSRIAGIKEVPSSK